MKLLLLSLLAAVFLSGPVRAETGPISPHLHPSTRLREAIRRMRMSLDRELVYLAHVDAGTVPPSRMSGDESDADDDDDDGFTDQINTGDSLFAPIRPGTSVPPANVFDDDGASASSPEPPEPSTSPSTPTLPSVTPDIFSSPSPVPEMSTTPILDPSPSFIDPTITPPVFTESPIPTDGPTETSIPRETPTLPTSTPPVETDEPIISPTPEPSSFVDPVPSRRPSRTPLVIPDGNQSVSPSASPSEESIDNNVAGVTQTPEFPDISPSVEISPESTTVASATSVSPTAGEEDDGDVCFPAHATVELRDGSFKKMADVQLGDYVRVGSAHFSQVFMFTHKLADVQYSFVHIRTQSGHSLSLTKGHYLYVNGVVAAAASVQLGDALTLADGTVSSVVRVETVLSHGLFNPQTVHGDIVVDGVRATTYTTTVDLSTAHSLLAPLRAVYSTIGWTLSAFDSGSDRLSSLIPSGSMVA